MWYYYVFLGIASLLFGGQFMVNKAYEKTNGQSLNASAKFAAMYGVFAFLIFFFANGCRLAYSNFSLIMAIALAVDGIVCSTVGFKTLSMGDIAVYSLFMMLGGMIVPYIYGLIFFRENQIGVWNIIGLVLMVGALVLPVFEKKKEKKKGNVLFYVLCIALFFLNGLSSTLMNIHQNIGKLVPSADLSPVATVDFTSWMFAAQAVLGGIMWLATSFIPAKRRNTIAVPKALEQIEESAEEAPMSAIGDCAEGDTGVAPASEESEAAKNAKKKKRQKFVRAVLCALAFAAVHGTASFLSLLSSPKILATAQYPIITGGTLVFSAILGRLIYKEKLPKLKIAQVAVAFVATILFIL